LSHFLERGWTEEVDEGSMTTLVPQSTLIFQY